MGGVAALLIQIVLYCYLTKEHGLKLNTEESTDDTHSNLQKWIQYTKIYNVQ